MKKFWSKIIEKHRLILLVLICFALVLAILIFVLNKISTTKTGDQNVTINQNTTQNITSSQSPSSAAESLGLNKSKSVQDSSSAGLPPEFTVYYPPVPPLGLIVDKSSISYGKDYFTYSLKQNGQNLFFVNEQPAGANFNYKFLRNKLSSPFDVDTSLGQGLVGTLGSYFITAVKTDKNTLIILNCTAIACSVPSANLIDTMKINNDPTHIKS